MKFLPVLLLLPFIASAQTAAISAEEWRKKLADPSDHKNEWHEVLYDHLKKLDSAGASALINQLQEKEGNENLHFKARFNCIKADLLYIKNLSENQLVLKNSIIKKDVIALLSRAMNTAYDCNDDYLTAFVSGRYGSYMYILKETESAVMYMMNCADLYEKTNISANYKTYSLLGDMLWSIREYDQCIKYVNKAVEVLKDDSSSSAEKDNFTMFCYNTIALAYKRLGRFDSAFAYYQKAMDAEKKVNRPVWKGIISGNMAQIYFIQEKYTTALALFTADYYASKKEGLYDNAGNAIQWVARTNLALGKKDSALMQVREALGLLQKWPQSSYLQNTCFTASEIFKAFKNSDSSFYYLNLYNRMHDSIERVVYQSSINIARLRLAEEKNKYHILNLQKEKQAQIRQRNYILTGIVAVCILVLLLINRRNQQLKFKQQLIDQEKMLIEQEMQFAKDQLQLFTQSLIEKTELIQQLENQMQVNDDAAERQESLSALSSLTILTDDDWTKFKSLFDKIYPLFFQRLKIKAPDITLAEQRMAALTRLQLTTKQMAAMQGISPDSVHKTRQRLRQRLGVSNEINLEEYLGEI